MVRWRGGSTALIEAVVVVVLLVGGVVAWGNIPAGVQREVAAGVELGPGVQAVRRLYAGVEQIRDCGGLTRQPALARFTAPPSLVEAVVCTGTGEHRVKASDGPHAARVLAALAAALAAEDEPRPYDSLDCTEPGQTLAPLTVRLADGRLLAPAAPIDTCGYPLRPTVQALDAVAGAVR